MTTCPTCGSLNQPNNRLCDQCGGTLPRSGGGGSRLTVGRNPDNDIVLPPHATQAARRQAEIVISQGQMTIQDLGSANGTYVRGTRIGAPTGFALSDEVRFGSLRFDTSLLAPWLGGAVPQVTRVTIGRDPANQIVLPPNVQQVARRQAEVTVSGGRATIVDLGSANGTFVDGVRIQGPTSLAPHQEVRFGTYRFDTSRLAPYLAGEGIQHPPSPDPRPDQPPIPPVPVDTPPVRRGPDPKRLAMALAALICLALLGTAIALWSKSRGKLPEALRAMPADASLVIVAHDVRSLWERYQGDDVVDEARGGDDSVLSEFIDDFTDETGLGFGDVEDGAAGVDWSASGGFCLVVERQQLVGVLVLPVRNRDAMAEFLDDLVSEAGIDTRRRGSNGRDVVEVEGGELAWAFVGDDFVMTIADEDIAGDYLEDLADGRHGSALETPWARSLAPLFKEEWHVAALGNPEISSDLLEEVLEEFDLEDGQDLIEDRLDEVLGFGASLYMGSDAIRGRARLALKKGADWHLDELGTTGNDTLAKYLSGDVVAAARVPLDPETWYDWASDLDEGELRETERMFRKELGIDLEDDVIAALGSPLTVAVFDTGERHVPYSVVGWVPLRGRTDLDDLLEDVESAMLRNGADVESSRSGDARWYQLSDGDGDMAWGVSRGNLVFAVGENRIESLASDLGTTSVSSSGGRTVASALGTHADLAGFVDLAGVVDQFEDAIEDDSDLQPIAGLLARLHELRAEIDLSRDAIDLQVQLTGDRDAAFVTGVQDLFSELGNGYSRTRLRALRSEAPTNLDAIRTAEKAFHAEWDRFHSCSWTPSRVPRPGPRSFTSGGLTEFIHLGWVADGPVRCRYKVDARSGSTTTMDRFEAVAECDVDGDGIVSRYRATERRKAQLMTPEGVY